MANQGSGDGKRPLLGGGELLRQDVERKRGGGDDKYHPFSVEQAWENLAPQGEELRNAVIELPAERRGRHVIVEAKLLPNYLAATHFPGDLLSEFDLYAVGSRPARGVYKTEKELKTDVPTKTLLVAGEPANILALAAATGRRPKGDSDPVWLRLREFETLGLPDPATILRSPRERASAPGTWEAVLAEIGRSDTERDLLNNEAFVRWTKLVKKLGGSVDVAYRRRVGGVTYVPVTLDADAAAEAAAFNLLRALRPMPTVRPIPTGVLRSALRLPAPPEPGSSPSSDLRVAVFDGGVDPGAIHLQPYVTSEDLTTEAPIQAYVDHGTLVTSALLFGPLDPKSPSLGVPPAHVDHFRVFPLPAHAASDHSLYWLLDTITRTIRERGYKHVNLSLGPDLCVDDDGPPDRWTAELDQLAHECGVTIAVAAGNNGESIEPYNRVQVPADMTNGIGVGACNSNDTSKRIRRAPYSAVGPGGSGQRLQPLGVAFGGCSKAKELFYGIGANALLADQGTSFASPFAMRGLLGLAHRLGERTSPESLRAFAAHFAQRQNLQIKTELGAGRLLSDYAPAFECAPNEASVLYQTSIARAETVVMGLPFPDGLDDDLPIGVRWTICFSSAVDSTDPSEYALSGVEMTLRPHSRRYTLMDAITKKTIAVLDQELDKAEYLSHVARRATQWSTAPAPAKKGKVWKRTEADLRGAGKWQTLLRGSLTLPAAGLHKPALDLLHLAREGGVLVRDVEPLSVSMLVTFTAPEGVALYDAVRAANPVLTPLAAPVRVAA